MSAPTPIRSSNSGGVDDRGQAGGDLRAGAWSHWDLWFCLVAHLDHDGDLVALADAIGDEHRFYGHSDTEAKLSHLDDLADRLAAAGLDAGALAARAGDHGALRTKARTKVLKQGLQPGE